jgi:hypothetical protein
MTVVARNQLEHCHMPLYLLEIALFAEIQICNVSFLEGFVTRFTPRHGSARQSPAVLYFGRRNRESGGEL